MAQTKVKLISDGVIVQGNLHASHGITTAHIGEGSNLYYTDARVGSYLSTNSFATESYVGTQITNLVDSSPATLNTLNELAAALGDDPNFATTTATSIGLKAPLASPSFTGNSTFAGPIYLLNTSARISAGGSGEVGFNYNTGATGSLVWYGGGTASKFNVTSAGNATFAGNISGVRGFFNSGATNVVATFTSTDGTATLQCADPTGNVEFGASGDNFVVQPAGGVAQLTVGAGSSVFAEQLGIGTSPGSNMLYVKGTTNGTDITTRFAPFSNNSSSTFFLSSVSSGDGGYFYNSNNNTSGLFSYGDYTFYVGTGNLSGNGPANARMVIKQDGNIGIGTTTPGNSILDIHFNDSYGSYGPVRGVNVTNETTTGAAGFVQLSARYNNTNNTFYQVGGIGGGKETTLGDGQWGGYLSFFTTSDGTAGAASGMFEHMRITADGNVGVGTTSPSSLLTLNKATGEVGILLEGNGTDVAKFKLSSAGVNHAVQIGSVSNNEVQFHTANSEKMRLAANGNVGINTTDPNDGDLTINAPKLHVVGPQTAGAYNLTARFQGGNDSDNTGASILINHSNDRGLLIKAGRKDGDREVAYFDLVSSGANITNILTMGKFSSDYNVGIGTTSPQTKLQTNLPITGAYLSYLNGTSATFDAQPNIAVVHNSPSIGSATAAGLVLANNDKSNGAPSPIIAFSAKSASNTYNHTYAAIYGIRTASGADTNWTKGDLVLATGSGTGPSERMRVLSSGGITFNGDTAAANALDDYEEGTWTPTNLGTSGFSSHPTVLEGRYTKIGRQVIVSFVLKNYSAGVGLCNIVLGGFPFVQHIASHDETGYCNVYPRGSRRSGLILNNSGGDVNNWWVGFDLTSAASGTDRIRGTVVYTTT